MMGHANIKTSALCFNGGVGDDLQGRGKDQLQNTLQTSTTDELIVDESTPPPTPTEERNNDRKSLLYHIRTLWLFTVSDIKCIVGPVTTFGIFSALSGPCMTTNSSPRLEDIFFRLPRILLWIWLNLLVFDIANQRLPHAILEDRTNKKSSRPLPSGRLSVDQARLLLLSVIPILLVITYFIGGTTETFAAMVLTWMYNDLGAGQEHYILRNLINAGGFMSYNTGAAHLAAGVGQYDLNSTAYAWIAMIGAIVATTIQIQDLSDIEGDGAVGRKTIPLVYGAMFARWSIAIPVAFWTLFCPYFWELGVLGYISLGIVGFLFVGRVLLLRNVAADRVSFKIWCLWLIVIYSLPVMKDYGALTGFWNNWIVPSLSVMSKWIASSLSDMSKSILSSLANIRNSIAPLLSDMSSSIALSFSGTSKSIATLGGKWSTRFMNWEVAHQLALPNTSYVLHGLGAAAIMIVVSVIIYRLYFHPLAKYPGPFFAKITDWYNVYHCLIGDRHLEFARIHNKYGKIVRYGPNRLSFCSATGAKAIYSTRANVQKSSMFEVFPHFFNSHSTMTMINTVKGRYAQKRRVTAQALNDQSLKSIEDDTLPIFQQLCDSMGPTKDRQWSQARNVKTMVGHMSFDMMGTVCFGKSFDMMDNTDNHYITGVLSKGAHALNTIGHMLPLLKTGAQNLLFRDLLNGLQRYKEYSKFACMTRINEGSSRTKSDVMGCILEAKDTSGKPLFSTAELISEASLLITAGSDTTSTTISSTIFYLLHFPSTLAIAQAEVYSAFASLEEIHASPKLYGCTYLRACMQEALRMSPPVGGLLAREICPGGMTIDGETLPEGTEVGTPIYAIQHCEEYYPDPFTYKPERWLNEDEEAKARVMSAFMAWSTGPRGCVGKAMAIQECMTVLGRLLWMFEWRLKNGSTAGEGKVGVKGERGRKNEYQMWDTFTSVSDGPEVEFKAREGAIK